MKAQLRNTLVPLFGDIHITSMRFPSIVPALYPALFTLCKGVLREAECIFVMDRGKAALTPVAIEKHLQQLRTYLGENLIYVGVPQGVHDIPRMMQRGLPFVVPGKAISLPFLAVQYRQTKASKPLSEKFSTCEQLILLWTLLKGSTDGFTAHDLMEDLPYTRVSLQTAFDALQQRGLAILERLPGSRKLTLCFRTTGKQLWEAAQPYLVSPVKKTVGVQVPPTDTLAGIDALAQRTHLGEAETPTTYAIAHRDFTKLNTECMPLQLAPIKLQLWAYPPTFLGDDQIDLFSLLLSLKDELDERVQSECDKLLENFKW